MIIKPATTPPHTHTRAGFRSTHPRSGGSQRGGHILLDGHEQRAAPVPARLALKELRLVEVADGAGALGEHGAELAGDDGALFVRVCFEWVVGLVEWASTLKG